MTNVGKTSELYQPGPHLTRKVPRDGRLIALILASKGVGDADDRVIHQLLDFSHRTFKLHASFSSNGSRSYLFQ
jgi:hypothetical protein